MKNREFNIILIGNYPKDNQESMIRFSEMLQSGFENVGLRCDIWNPIIFFGKFCKSTTSGIGKWLGYLDKYILFPIILRFRTILFSSKSTIYHICDHSNSIYLPHIISQSKGITCHDVLAIRGALGYNDAYCEASKFGKILQKWILKNLENAQRIAAVSELTLNQLKELTKFDEEQKRLVIYNSFNAKFCRLRNEILQESLKPLHLSGKPYILHVGSSLPRKNRNLLIYMLAELKDKWDGVICYAGEPLEGELLSLAIKFNLSSRIISVIKPTHEVLVSLYNGCEAFIFPSYSEGFGWPVIEAQCCGTPVIASSVEPMPEISGGSALHIYPDDSKGFANAFLKLKDPNFRNEIINNGYQNVKRFERKIMIEKYLSFYK